MALFKGLTDCTTPEGVPTLACLGTILQNIVVMLLIATAVASLFMLILGGIRYSLSGGDPKKVGSAKGTITYAIIGLVLAFLAFVFIQVIATVTGNTDIINGPKITMPTTAP